MVAAAAIDLAEAAGRQELDLTIVIVSYRCADLLRACLDSLRQDGIDRRARVVVVDNDSRDGTAEMVEGAFPAVELRRERVNRGFSTANNLVLRELDSELVLLLNPDTVVPPGAISRAVDAIRERPQVGMLGCKLVRADGSLDHACRRTLPTPATSALYFAGARWALGKGRDQGYAATARTADEGGPVEAINGAFMLVRREAIDQVGLLDERFWMYGEDLDWCLRFARAGWAVHYLPEVAVTHLKGATDGGVRSRRANRAFHRAMWLYYAKHQASRHPVPVRLAVRAAIAARYVLAEHRTGPLPGSGAAAGPATGIRRPLTVAVASPDRRLASRVAHLDPERILVAPVDLPDGWAALGELLGAVRAERPDLIVLDPTSLDRRATAVATRALRACGWRTVTVAEADEAGWSAARLSRAAARPGAGLRGGPPVSVVATVLDERAAARELVHQVVAQLGDDDELIIADGGSLDGTAELLDDLATTIPALAVVRAPGSNISGGRNAAIRAARHRVIATVDAGCHLGPGWLDALRLPFADDDADLGLVAGVPQVAAATAMGAAQRAACYPDPVDSAHPTLGVRVYTGLFGTAFDPAEPFARFLAFTRDAWEAAGGFPEDLGWTEDGIFGRRVADRWACRLVTDGTVTWDQRQDLAATFRMYRNYGRGAFLSADRALLWRDSTRAVAYGLALLGLAGSRALRRAVVAGGIAYLSLPLARARRQGAGAGAALVPVALMVKDLGKVTGELGAWRTGRRS